MGRTCHKSQRLRGFTLIEVLVVITIIMVLIGLVAVGFRAMQNSQRGNATGVTMSNLKGYLREIQDRKATPPWMPTGAVSLPAADNMGEEKPADRYGELTIITQRALRAALQVPSNRAAYNQLPKEKRMDVLRLNSGVNYLPGDQTAVADSSGNKTYYVRNDSNAWVVDNTPHTALLLDGWGNPILFVPGPAPLPAQGVNQTQVNNAYGLHGVRLQAVTGSPAPVVNPRSLPWNLTNWQANYKNIRAYQPFWASAGPDGSFVKGDDNVYSFDLP